MYDCFIGIDPSLSGTSVCEFFPEEPDCFIVDTHATEARDYSNPVLRMHDIVDYIMEKITKHKKEDIKILIEGFSYHSRGQALFEIAGLGYLIRSAMIKAGYSYFDVPPTSLKMFTCFNGNAKKELMLLSCYKRYGYDNRRLKDNNQVDSYCLARMGEAYFKWLTDKDQHFNQKELQAFKKMATEITDGKEPV